MARVPIVCILSLLVSACGPGPDGEPATETTLSTPSQVAFQLEERDLFPEGIAYDPVTERFFLGSLLKSKIISVSMSGEVDTLLDMEQLGLGGILGMVVNPRERVLWAAFHQAADQVGADTTVGFRTGIHKIDLEDGRLIRSYSVEKTEENHLFNDIALAADGTIYITSFATGTLYRISSESDELEEWLPMPEGVSTNGIAMGPDGRFLLVVGSDQIYRVEIETGETVQLGVPEGEFLGSGDGLYFHDGGLVVLAIHMENDEYHHRVLRLHLSDDQTAVTRVQILDQDHPLYAFPTTGALVDGWLYYIATAQFDKLDGEGNVAPWDELSDIYILKVEVPR